MQRYVAYGRKWKEMFAAARAGPPVYPVYEVVDGGFHETARLARRKEELDFPPDAMFAYIKYPALAVAGSHDRNVPPEHARCIDDNIRKGGNPQVRRVAIDEADHNFQIAPADEDLAIRDREVLPWMEEYFPVHGHHHQPEGPSRNTELERSLYSRGVQGPEKDEQTGVSPPRLHLAPRVTIIDDILNKKKTPGVETLEGRIGPLLRTGEMRAYFIDMPAGLYLEEHPHTEGSIIDTVSGQWGLKSLGRWHLMKPGSEDGDFLRYLWRLAEDLRRDQKSGTSFRLVDLPADRPALRFAREVNPRFDAEFVGKQ